VETKDPKQKCQREIKALTCHFDGRRNLNAPIWANRPLSR